MQFDTDQQGFIHTNDLKQALEHLGEKCNDRQVFRMIAAADPENTGTLSLF